MADLDWSQCAAVESIEGKVSGAWVFRNTRLPVSVIFENLAGGSSMAEIMEWYGVSQEQFDAALDFVIKSLEAAPHLPKHTGPLPEWVQVISSDEELEPAHARSV